MDTCFFTEFLRPEAQFVIIVVQIDNLLAAHDGLPIHDALPGQGGMLPSRYGNVRNLGL